MKKTLCLFALFVINSLSAQTLNEKKMIINSSNPAQVKELMETLKDNELARETKIALFLKQNTSVQREFSKDNKRFSLVDIIDGNPVFITSDNAAAARGIRVNHLYPGGSLGLSLEGEGIAVGVWDGGWVLTNHNEFVTGGTSRVTTPDAPTQTPDTEFHGTHVAGTIASKGMVSSSKGMAPKSTVRSYNWTNDETEVATDVAANALLISNHSYGNVIVGENGELSVPNWYMGSYISASREWDQIAYTFPYYMMVTSAGNNGTFFYPAALSPGIDKLAGNKTSKNVLVVANANPTVHPITGVMTSLLINPSSSQGPTDDGRIKPDIAADGTNLFSTSNASVSSYDTATGTSMSSPSVAGALVLLQEHYNNLHPSQYMRAATLKGLVCHTALDDEEFIGPDTRFGWGLLDARASAIVLTNSTAVSPSSVVNELVLTQGATYSLNVTALTLKTLKATVSWTDVPGVAKSGQLNSPAPALINDLDLRITKNEEVHFPWKFQIADSEVTAIKGDNKVDNIEKVEVEDAIGTYTIQVTHKGILNGGSQNYSLIISGFDTMQLSNQNFDSTKLVVHPNPVKDQLFITNTNNDSIQYELYDIQGRLVYELKTPTTNDLTINTSSLTKGVYMLNIISDNGSVVKKIVKE